MKTTELLKYFAPGKEWVLVGEPENELQYVEALTWISKGVSPTWQQLKDVEPKAEYDTAYAAVSAARHAAYIAPDGSDAIFMQYQRGQATEQAWLDRVAEINTANPYPDKPAGI